MTIYVIGPSDEPSFLPGNETIHIGADGEREYPCRCGQTHRGDYGGYDWGHHNCFHNSPLHELTAEVPGYLMCPDCGKTFWLAERAKPDNRIPLLICPTCGEEGIGAEFIVRGWNGETYGFACGHEHHLNPARGGARSRMVDPPTKEDA